MKRVTLFVGAKVAGQFSMTERVTTWDAEEVTVESAPLPGGCRHDALAIMITTVEGKRVTVYPAGAPFAVEDV